MWNLPCQVTICDNNAIIKRFRTDNGGEYVNAAMLTLLDKQGIVHDLTPAYSHESNSVAKRYNWIIITAARSLLTGLHLALWAEAIATGVYLRNRLSHQSIGKSTPYESLYHKKPSIYHLRPYGTSAKIYPASEARAPRPDASDVIFPSPASRASWRHFQTPIAPWHNVGS